MSQENPRQAYSRIKRCLDQAAYLARYAVRLPAYAFMNTESVFSDIYRRNIWGSGESCSGFGSSVETTAEIRRALPQIIQAYNIHSVLDIPCGDCHWISDLPLGVKYIGADIVEDLVAMNTRRHPGLGEFMRRNICTDPLPQADLVFCRDCLVHLSNKLVFAALENIRTSRSKFLLMTTFTGRATNTNTLTGAWRPLNFQKPPFCLPEPIMLVNESYRLRGGKYADKCMGMWRVKDIP